MDEGCRVSGLRSSLENASFHDIDNALNEIDQVFERVENRLAVSHAGFAERYLDRDFYFLWKARWSDGRSVDFTVIIQNIDKGGAVGDSEADPWEEWCRTWRPTPYTNPAFGGEENAGQAPLNASLRLPGRDGDNGVMFVHVIELPEHPKRLIPALVRLQPADEPISLDGHIFELSDTGFLETFSRTHDGKPIPVGRLLTVRPDQPTHHLVERGSEVMDHISDDDAPVIWDAFVDANAIDMLAGARVVLTNQFVWFGLEESLKGRVEISKVAFCPRHLKLGPKQRIGMRHV